MPTDADEAGDRMRRWASEETWDQAAAAADVHLLLDEREALLAWKAEAMAVLSRWDRVAALVPDMPLGASVADATYEYVKGLQARVAAAIVQHPRISPKDNPHWVGGWPDICGLCRSTWPCPTVHVLRGE